MKKENNKKIGLVVVGVIILLAVFYSGMVYGKKNQSKIQARDQGAQTYGIGNFAGGMMGGTRGMRNGGNFGGFTTGEIITKDDKSITVKLINGGSKIIFLDTNTKISKQADGILADLVIGTQISVTGVANADGSINAQSVQIRSNTAPAVVK